jgi:hypothetical protein
MDKRARYTFLILVLFQGLHSIEEYIGRLWEVFQPAHYLSGLISENREKGFLIANISLFIFGILIWLTLKNNVSKLTFSLIWFWIILEIINGLGHPMFSIYQQKYLAGSITAPFLLFMAIYLASLLIRLKDKNV